MTKNEATGTFEAGARAALLMLALGCSLYPSAAFAQTKIEQMIVTATKRAVDIQSVPASISAFSGEGLRERQINTIQDLSMSTPNVNMSAQHSSISTLSIRGVSTDGLSHITDGTVAMHVNGVYQARTGNLQQTLFDLESVEILRGPQGTLYGRNANAGVVNFNTAKPTDTFEGSGTIFGGSYTRYGARGYVSGPITDQISVRLSGMVDRNDGYSRNLTNGHRIDGLKTYGGRFSVRLRPTEDLVVDLVSSSAFTKSTHGLFTNSPLTGFNIAGLQAAGVDTRSVMTPHKTYLPFDPDSWTKEYMQAAIVNWDIDPDFSVKSITGYQGFGSNALMDYGTIPYDSVKCIYRANSHTLSQEFNVTAKFFDRLDVVGGLYYMKDNAGGGALCNLPAGFPMNPSAALPRAYGINDLMDQDTTSKAAFFDLTFSVTDQLRIVGGLRRTFDKRESVQHVQSFFFSPDSLDSALIQQGLFVGGCSSINHVLPTQKYSSTTGKLGLQYDFTPEITGYVSWQNGFKDGGYSISVCDDDYAPERIYSWEAGLKGSYFSDTLTLNIAVFDYRYSNMQILRQLGVASEIDNASSSRLKGAEIEATAYLTDDLKMNLGVGILDGKYGPSLSVNANIPSNPVVDLDGLQLARAPKITLSAGLEYTMRLGDIGELKSRAEYSFTSRNYFTVYNEAIAKQDAYSLVNLLFTFTPDDSPLSFQVYARNLLDKPYRTGVWVGGAINYNSNASWGAPRLLGAEVTAKF